MLGSRDRVTSGNATFAGDWIKAGWTPFDLTLGAKVELKATVHGLENVVHGDAPGFRDVAADDYSLLAAASRDGCRPPAGCPRRASAALPVREAPTGPATCATLDARCAR